MIRDNIQWSTDGCQLLSTNLTHSICLFNHLNTFALFMNNEQVCLRFIIEFKDNSCFYLVEYKVRRISFIIYVKNWMSHSDYLSFIDNYYTSSYAVIILYIEKYLFKTKCFVTRDMQNISRTL